MRIGYLTDEVLKEVQLTKNNSSDKWFCAGKFIQKDESGATLATTNFKETLMQESNHCNPISKSTQMKTREEKISLVLLFTAIILGALVRLLHVASSNFPINDGGLFYTMTRELQGNGFLIPATTSITTTAEYPSLTRRSDFFYWVRLIRSSAGYFPA